MANKFLEVASDFMKSPGRWLGPDTGAPFKHLTPEEVEAFRPKPVEASPASAAHEAGRWARHLGLREMEPLIYRLILAEQTIAELQSTVLKLKRK